MKDLPNLCMFCGKDESFGEMNREHFVPRCFWTKCPSSMKVAPAHVACNSKNAADSEYLRDVLCGEYGTDQHPEAARVINGPLERKWKKRRSAMLKVMKNVKIEDVYSPGGVYLGTAPTFTMDWIRIQNALTTVMRGVFFSAIKEPMPQDFKFTFYPYQPPYEKFLRPLVELMPTPWKTFGDDVFATRYQLDINDSSMICLMVFYKRRAFMGIANAPDPPEKRSPYCNRPPMAFRPARLDVST